MTDYRRMVWQYYANVVALLTEWGVIFIAMSFRTTWWEKLGLLVLFLVARFVDKRTLLYRVIWL